MLENNSNTNISISINLKTALYILYYLNIKGINYE